MPNFAANLSMLFNEYPFPGRFAAAAKAGFNAVEYLFPYDYSPQDLKQWLQENHLKNVLFNMPPGDWSAGERGMAVIPGRQAEFRAGVAKAVEYALTCETPQIHMMAGVVPRDADLKICRQIYLENMKYAAGELEKHGIDLLIEPINIRDMPGYFLNFQDQAHELRIESGCSNVKVQMDFYHAQIMEGDLLKTFEKYFEGVGHIQIASVPARHEPDEGELNYPFIFDFLDQAGYKGWIGCEYRPRANTEDGLAWFKNSK